MVTFCYLFHLWSHFHQPDVVDHLVQKNTFLIDLDGWNLHQIRLHVSILLVSIHQNTTKTMNHSMNIDYKMYSIMFKVNSLPWFVFVYLDWKLKNELRWKNNTHSGMNKDILHNSFHGMGSHLYKIPNLWSRSINRLDLFKGFKTLEPYSMGQSFKFLVSNDWCSRKT